MARKKVEKKRRGRPIGYVVSAETRLKISATKRAKAAFKNKVELPVDVAEYADMFYNQFDMFSAECEPNYEPVAFEYHPVDKLDFDLDPIDRIAVECESFEEPVFVMVPKKKRGRPSKKNQPVVAIEKKKRGRPKGSKNTKKAEVKAKETKDLTVVDEYDISIIENKFEAHGFNDCKVDVCEKCGAALIKDKVICPYYNADVLFYNTCSECGGMVIIEEDESFCTCCGHIATIKVEKPVVEVAIEVPKVEKKKEIVEKVKTNNHIDIEKIIKDEHKLFTNLANKYSNKFTGDKEDLYQELVIKTYEIYNKEKSRFRGNSDFKNFLARSLKNFCINDATYKERRRKREGAEIPENYSGVTSSIEYTDLTEREQYLIRVFDILDTEKYNIKKWNNKKLLNFVCKDIAAKEGTDAHYIMREFKALATKIKPA